MIQAFRAARGPLVEEKQQEMHEMPKFYSALRAVLRYMKVNTIQYSTVFNIKINQEHR